MTKKVLLVATVQSHICQFHRPLVEMLHQRGYEIHVAARNNLAEKNGLKLDFAEEVFDIPFVRSPFSPQNIKAYRLLKQIVRDGQYDIIHCNTPIGGVLARIVAKRSHSKSMVIYTAHGFHFFKGAPLKNWIVYYPIEKILGKYTDKLITINTEDYNLAQKRHFCKEVYLLHGVGVNSNRYSVPSNEERKIFKQKFGLENKIVILNIGELRKNKNQYMAIRAIKRLIPEYPNIKLLIAGNGPEDARLKKFVNENGMEKHVTFLGYVTNLQDYQKATDIQVACSKREGLGLNLLESFLSGNPVVASKNRGHIDCVDAGKNGYLVDYDDDTAMAKYIKILIDHKDLRAEMSMNCRKKGLLFSCDVVKEELAQIYFG